MSLFSMRIIGCFRRNVQADRGISEVIASGDASTVISAEFLDAPRFAGDAYVQTVITFLREKYLAHPLM